MKQNIIRTSRITYLYHRINIICILIVREIIYIFSLFNSCCSSEEMEEHQRSLQEGVRKKKIEKSGSAASSAKKDYIFSSQLSFLSSISETRPPKSSDKVEEDTDVQTARSEGRQDLPKIGATKKRKCLTRIV